MIVAIIYSPDPELGPDPNDEHHQPRSIGQFIGDGSDVFVLWREWGDQYKGGFRNRVVGQGIWEHLTNEQIDRALDAIEAPE